MASRTQRKKKTHISLSQPLPNTREPKEIFSHNPEEPTTEQLPEKEGPRPEREEEQQPGNDGEGSPADPNPNSNPNPNDLQQKHLEELTCGQTNSKLWMKFCSGRITASQLHQVVHTDPHKPSISLLKVICYPDSVRFTTAATKFGCEH